MVDVDSGTMAAAAASLLALDPIKKILGPTADFIGAELAAYAKRRFANAEKIIEIAAEHAAGSSQPDETVSARVLLDAVEEGSKVETEIAQKYFGGVLASSVSKGGKNDSSIIFTSILSEMSSSQIKLHCLLYSGLRERWKGEARNLGDEAARTQLTTAVDFEAMVREYGPEIITDLEPSMFGLYRIGLIDHFEYGHIRLRPATDNTPPGIASYIKFKPTVLGCSLFLTACGRSGCSASEILSTAIDIKPMITIDRRNTLSLSEIQPVDPAALRPQPVQEPPT